MRFPKVVLAGGTGFIGRGLAGELLARGCELVVLTRQTTVANPLPGVEYITHDFASVCVPKLQGAEIFIHLASDINWKSSSFAEGVTNVLRFVGAFGDSLKKAIFASSIMVYPMVGAAPFVEGRDEDAENLYGANKLVFEDAMAWLARQRKIHFLSARIGQVYGANMRVNRILPDTIEKARRGEVISLYGDGSQSTDWTYIADVVDGLLSMIDYPGSGCFNIGSGAATSNRVLAESCVRLLNSASTIEYATDKALPARQQALDLTKSRAELGYSPRYDFAAGVAKMLESQ